MKIRSAAYATALLLIFAGDGRAGTFAGYAGVNVNIRSGPSVQYPAVGSLAAGSPLTIHGCLSRHTWCDVSAAAGRGWVSGAYIQFDHQARRVYLPAYVTEVEIPVVTFNLGSYWHDYYQDYGFYGEFDRWGEHNWERDGDPPGWRDNWNDGPPEGEY